MSRLLTMLLTLSCLACGGGPEPADAARATRDDAPLKTVDFTLDRLGAGVGRTVSLAELRGRIVLVSYMTTWCRPCQQALPGLDRLARGLEALTVVVVSMDDEYDDRGRATDGAPMLEAMELVGFDPTLHPVAWADTAQRVGKGPFGAIDAVPVSYLVDARGRHVETLHGIPPIVYLHRRVLELSGEGGP